MSQSDFQETGSGDRPPMRKELLRERDERIMELSAQVEDLEESLIYWKEAWEIQLAARRVSEELWKLAADLSPLKRRGGSMSEMGTPCNISLNPDGSLKRECKCALLETAERRVEELEAANAALQSDKDFLMGELHTANERIDLLELTAKRASHYI